MTKNEKYVEKYNKLKEKTNVFYQKYTEYKQLLEQNKEEKIILQDELCENKNIIDSQKLEINKLNNTIEELNDSIEELNDTIEELTHKYKESKKNIKELKNNIKEEELLQKLTKRVFG